tara:strand:+ start:1495 stop:1665 length:171 start_codon:yes stop_codon:yes gene_type:complete
MINKILKILSTGMKVTTPGIFALIPGMTNKSQNLSKEKPVKKYVISKQKYFYFALA